MSPPDRHPYGSAGVPPGGAVRQHYESLAVDPRYGPGGAPASGAGADEGGRGDNVKGDVFRLRGKTPATSRRAIWTENGASKSTLAMTKRYHGHHHDNEQRQTQQRKDAKPENRRRQGKGEGRPNGQGETSARRGGWWRRHNRLEEFEPGAARPTALRLSRYQDSSGNGGVEPRKFRMLQIFHRRGKSNLGGDTSSKETDTMTDSEGSSIRAEEERLSRDASVRSGRGAIRFLIWRSKSSSTEGREDLKRSAEKNKPGKESKLSFLKGRKPRSEPAISVGNKARKNGRGGTFRYLPGKAQTDRRKASEGFQRYYFNSKADDGSGNITSSESSTSNDAGDGVAAAAGESPILTPSPRANALRREKGRGVGDDDAGNKGRETATDDVGEDGGGDKERNTATNGVPPNVVLPRVGKERRDVGDDDDGGNKKQETAPKVGPPSVVEVGSSDEAVSKITMLEMPDLQKIYGKGREEGGNKDPADEGEHAPPAIVNWKFLPDGGVKGRIYGSKDRKDGTIVKTSAVIIGARIANDTRQGGATPSPARGSGGGGVGRTIMTRSGKVYRLLEGQAARDVIAAACAPQIHSSRQQGEEAKERGRMPVMEAEPPAAYRGKVQEEEGEDSLSLGGDEDSNSSGGWDDTVVSTAEWWMKWEQWGTAPPHRRAQKTRAANDHTFSFFKSFSKFAGCNAVDTEGGGDYASLISDDEHLEGTGVMVQRTPSASRRHDRSGEVVPYRGMPQ